MHEGMLRSFCFIHLRLITLQRAVAIAALARRPLAAESYIIERVPKMEVF